MDQPELIEDPRFATLRNRAHHIDVAYDVVVQAMPNYTTAEWRVRLNAADIPNGPANTLQDIVDDPYLAQTGFFTEHEHPVEGRLVMMAVPVAFSASPTALQSLPAKLGADTEAVLREAGLTEPEVLAAMGRQIHAA